MPKSQKSYSCPHTDCTKTFKKPVDLEQHMNTHQGIRPFSCNLCSKAYYKKYHLTVHEKIHSEPQFRCTKCEKPFITKDKLIRHEKIHEKVFECSRCKKIYVRKKMYDKHVLKHEKKKVIYECEICKSLFNYKKYLRNHIKRRHDTII